jgi:hypothetical protein
VSSSGWQERGNEENDCGNLKVAGRRKSLLHVVVKSTFEALTKSYAQLREIKNNFMNVQIKFMHAFHVDKHLCDMRHI